MILQQNQINLFISGWPAEAVDYCLVSSSAKTSSFVFMFRGSPFTAAVLKSSYITWDQIVGYARILHGDEFDVEDVSGYTFSPVSPVV
jgi:hypothetical protein